MSFPIRKRVGDEVRQKRYVFAREMSFYNKSIQDYWNTEIKKHNSKLTHTIIKIDWPKYETALELKIKNELC